MRARRRVPTGRRYRRALWTGAAALALALLAGIAPRPAHANAEQFSTFSAEQQEDDDEAIMDHLLARQPLAWRDEWERSSMALRTSQGCLTSGQWIDLTQLKLETAMGKKARFGLVLDQRYDDIMQYSDIALSFRFPIRAGRILADFHPYYDKSRQDFSLGWDTGPDTSAFFLNLTFMVEDMFNNLWAWRQSHVGQVPEPYLKHPYLPQFTLISRHEIWRLDLGGRYLTPSVKQVADDAITGIPNLYDLWGTYGWAELNAHAGGFGWQARTDNLQALSTTTPIDGSAGNHLDFRRQWSVEGMISRDLWAKWSALARYFYQERSEQYGEGLGPGRFGAVDRVYQFELARAFSPGWSLRAGGLYDRLGYAHEGITMAVSEIRKKESRAYITLAARFGKVSLEGTEGIELDIEPYPVTWHHDKGFLKLQTTF